MEDQLGAGILEQMQDNAAPGDEVRLQQRVTELRDGNRDLAAQRDELAASLLRHREEFDAAIAARAAFDAASPPPPPTEASRALAAAPDLSTKDSTSPPVSSTAPGSTAFRLRLSQFHASNDGHGDDHRQGPAHYFERRPSHQAPRLAGHLRAPARPV
ncbi:hypothetical protein M885DRAFT_528612 [Pelagophyceae sp. CCMP2097]|nr:hypothetical protein M885DRAFT_528612 [Pelagophyceae sp. CCMP2097]